MIRRSVLIRIRLRALARTIRYACALVFLSDGRRHSVAAWERATAEGRTRLPYVDWLDERLDAESIALGYMCDSSVHTD